jgi:hypothetical protein
MKFKVFLILMTVLLVACDPYGFGFKKNPAYVLDQAFKSIIQLNDARFVEVSGREALCLYGNAEGMSYLRNNLTFDQKQLAINPTIHSVKYTNAPEFVGYWSYYSERYMVEINDKRSGETYVSTVIDCHYGIDGQKNDAFINLPKKKYRRKECRLVKIIPVSFAPLSLPGKCPQMFQVQL